MPAVQQMGQSCSSEWRGGQVLSTPGGVKVRQAMEAWAYREKTPVACV